MIKKCNSCGEAYKLVRKFRVCKNPRCKKYKLKLRRQHEDEEIYEEKKSKRQEKK